MHKATDMQKSEISPVRDPSMKADSSSASTSTECLKPDETEPVPMPEWERKLKKRLFRKIKKNNEGGGKWLSKEKTAAVRQTAMYKYASAGMDLEKRTKPKIDPNRPPTPEHFWNISWWSPEKKQ